jgi:hypothetical protein
MGNRVFLNKKFSNYLGEQRALNDIVVRYESVIAPSPTSVTPTPTPTPSASPIPSTPTQTATTTLTTTPTQTQTQTQTPSATLPVTPTNTSTNTPTPTPSGIPLFCIDNGFDTQTTGSIVSTGDTMYVFGQMGFYDNNIINKIVRISQSTGLMDGSFVAGFVSGFVGGERINCGVEDSQGNLYLGGNFTTYDGVSQLGLVKINNKGEKNTIFNIGTGFNAAVNYLVLDEANNSLYVAGAYTTYQGVTINRLVKLNATTAVVDATFNISTGFGGSVFALALDGAGGLYAGGAFTSFTGSTNNRIIKLNATTGAKDTTFVNTTGFNSSINDILWTGTDLICTGIFTTYKGVSFNRIIKLDTSGNNVAAFNTGTGFNGNVNSAEIDSSGRIICAGSFTTFSAITANRLARINSNGTFDQNFQNAQGTGFLLGYTAISGYGNGIQLDASENIYVAGGFGSFDGRQLNNFLKLNPSGTSITYNNCAYPPISPTPTNTPTSTTTPTNTTTNTPTQTTTQTSTPTETPTNTPTPSITPSPNPIFVAGGELNTEVLGYSSDGITWNASSNANSIFTTRVQGIAYNGSLFVAGGAGTNVLGYSTDGITWSGSANGNTLFNLRAEGIAWDGNLWVAAGRGPETLLYSTDGITWSASTNGSSIIGLAGRAVSYDGSLWVAGGSKGIGTSCLAYSNDGITWSASTNGDTIFDAEVFAVASDGNLWVAAGRDNNKLGYSTDGITWSASTNGNSFIGARGDAVAYNGSIWLAGGNAGPEPIVISTDGITWSATTNGSLIFDNRVNDIAWNGSLWVAGGKDNNRIGYSTDGLTWSASTSANAIFLQEILAVASRPAPNLFPPR